MMFLQSGIKRLVHMLAVGQCTCYWELSRNCQCKYIQSCQQTHASMFSNGYIDLQLNCMEYIQKIKMKVKKTTY